jgi:hypothetical protein
MIRKIVLRATEGDLVARVVTAVLDMALYGVLIVVGLLVSDVFQAAGSALALAVTLVAGTVIALMLYDEGHEDLAGAMMLVLAVVLVDYFVDNRLAEAVKNFVAKFGKK